jgi:hypothetical protein
MHLSLICHSLQLSRRRGSGALQRPPGRLTPCSPPGHAMTHPTFHSKHGRRRNTGRNRATSGQAQHGAKGLALVENWCNCSFSRCNRRKMGCNRVFGGCNRQKMTCNPAANLENRIDSQAILQRKSSFSLILHVKPSIKK